jgi:hypothetical protein
MRLMLKPDCCTYDSARQVVHLLQRKNVSGITWRHEDELIKAFESTDSPNGCLKIIQFLVFIGLTIKDVQDVSIDRVWGRYYPEDITGRG